MEKTGATTFVSGGNAFELNKNELVVRRKDGKTFQCTPDKAYVGMIEKKRFMGYSATLSGEGIGTYKLHSSKREDLEEFVLTLSKYGKATGDFSAIKSPKSEPPVFSNSSRAYGGYGTMEPHVQKSVLATSSSSAYMVPTMIACPCCGNPISSQAVVCPHCGQPMINGEEEFAGVYKATLFHGMKEVRCPRCESEDCSHYMEQHTKPGKTKTTYSANLNPLKPLTFVNKNEKVVRKEKTVTYNKFICNKCGYIFW